MHHHARNRVLLVVLAGLLLLFGSSADAQQQANSTPPAAAASPSNVSCPVRLVYTTTTVHSNTSWCACATGIRRVLKCPWVAVPLAAVFI